MTRILSMAAVGGLAWLMVAGGHGIRTLWAQNTEARGFTVDRSIAFVLGDGTIRPGTQERYALRGDGAFYAFTAHRHGGLARITLPNEKLHILIDPVRKKKSTEFVANQAVLDRFVHRKSSGDNCSSYVGSEAKLLGSETYLNVPVVVYGELYDQRVKAYAHLHKLAPSMNCFTLYREDTWVDEAGNITSRTIQKAERVQIGEPDPHLFEAPSLWEEIPPSKLKEEHMRGGGGSAAIIPQRFRNSDPA